MNAARSSLRLAGLFLFLACSRPLLAQTNALSGGAPTDAVLLSFEGRVETAHAGSTEWSAGQTNQVLRVGDRLRTSLRSRATVRLSSLSVLRVNELTTLQIQSPSAPGKSAALNLNSGAAYFLSRERPGELEFRTPTASGAIRGTEFHLAVGENGRTEVTLLDGAIALSNDQGAVDLASGEQGVVEAGKAPVKTAVINALTIIQWCLYYPGVLDVDELVLSADEQATLAGSLAAYRSGDLLGALAKYPEGRVPASNPEKIYRAALLLAVGQVEQSEAQLRELQTRSPLADALREVVAAVKSEPWTRSAPAATATEWLAESYQLQSHSKLDEALQAARAATAKSPNFGFAWARVAELEFSFGRVPAAQVALEKSLALAPRNAEAAALKGFLLAAQNKIPAARKQFENAMALDSALGNAWLGRGLVRIRTGDATGGRQDLQVAATLEPQRALLRSYLGKAFANARDAKRAAKELALARKLDPNDPTAWLYAALLDQQENQINDAVRDLEKSQELNDNRSLYRSRLLLDQDRAVRGANLANIYRDAGMTDVSVREAVKAVNADYANYSAHLFLANSFNELRDPQGVNLRYETPYVSEFLVANLLAPVGAGTLSQQVSQQEYSKLFERDGLGLSSSTEYWSHGNWRQGAAQYGTFGNSSFAVEEYYSSQHGYRPNSDQELTEYDFRFKQQFTPKDSLFLQVTLGYSSGGNLVQYYNQADAAAAPFRFRDRQEPIIIAGYHHEWSPGNHTLLLASRLSDVYSVTNPFAPAYVVARDSAAGPVAQILPFVVRQDYHSTLEIYTVEGQQIWQTPRFTTVAGARFQDGGFDNQNVQENFDVAFSDLFADPLIASQNLSTRFQRISVYGYEQWQALDSLRVIAGLSYERLVLPTNYRLAPISPNTETSHHLFPKAGAIWSPLKDTTVRAAYSESLSGASFDQSFQLEPTQVAGFNQAFRSLIPESVAGANAGATFTSYGVSLEQKFPTGTYVAVAGEILESTVKRQDGAFEFNDLGGPFLSGTRERLDFREKSISVSAHQLVGREWTFGAVYRLSHAQLKNDFTEVSDNAASATGFVPRTTLTGTLQTLDLRAIYQHRAGWFAQLNGTWTRQNNGGYQTPRAGDDVWQWDILAGYRFAQRQAAITVGVLNLTDRDYHLSPLNLYLEKPRDRTFYAQFSFHF